MGASENDSRNINSQSNTVLKNHQDSVNLVHRNIKKLTKLGEGNDTNAWGVSEHSKMSVEKTLTMPKTTVQNQDSLDKKSVKVREVRGTEAVDGTKKTVSWCELDDDSSNEGDSSNHEWPELNSEHSQKSTVDYASGSLVHQYSKVSETSNNLHSIPCQFNQFEHPVIYQAHPYTPSSNYQASVSYNIPCNYNRTYYAPAFNMQQGILYGHTFSSQQHRGFVPTNFCHQQTCKPMKIIKNVLRQKPLCPRPPFSRRKIARKPLAVGLNEKTLCSISESGETNSTQEYSFLTSKQRIQYQGLALKQQNKVLENVMSRRMLGDTSDNNQAITVDGSDYIRDGFKQESSSESNIGSRGTSDQVEKKLVVFEFGEHAKLKKSSICVSETNSVKCRGDIMKKRLHRLSTEGQAKENLQLYKLNNKSSDGDENVRELVRYPHSLGNTKIIVEPSPDDKPVNLFDRIDESKFPSRKILSSNNDGGKVLQRWSKSLVMTPNSVKKNKPRTNGVLFERDEQGRFIAIRRETKDLADTGRLCAIEPNTIRQDKKPRTKGVLFRRSSNGRFINKVDTEKKANATPMIAWANGPPNFMTGSVGESSGDLKDVRKIKTDSVKNGIKTLNDTCDEESFSSRTLSGSGLQSRFHPAKKRKKPRTNGVLFKRDDHGRFRAIRTETKDLADAVKSYLIKPNTVRKNEKPRTKGVLFRRSNNGLFVNQVDKKKGK